MNIAAQTYDAICGLYKNKPTLLHEPSFNGNEWTQLKGCLDSGWVSSAGPQVFEFEQQVADFTKSAYAIAVTNGSSGLHIALMLAGVKAGDEVLVPAISFVASSNTICYLDATPHFVDIQQDDFNVDPQKLKTYLEDIAQIKDGVCFNRKTGNPISALMVVHILGMPAKMSALKEICQQFYLELVEDAAESLGSFYQGQHTGTFGVSGVLSFNGNKIITTGGGGMILCQDKAKAEYARHITTQAKVNHPWAFIHDEVGYNYRLPNLNAALGVAQMQQLEMMLEQKRKLHEQYGALLDGIEGVQLLEAAGEVKANYWLNAIKFDSTTACETFLNHCVENQVQARSLWTPLPDLKMYQTCPNDAYETAKDCFKRVALLPSSASLWSEHD